jgi:hypothetical protein
MRPHTFVLLPGSIFFTETAHPYREVFEAFASAPFDKEQRQIATRFGTVDVHRANRERPTRSSEPHWLIFGWFTPAPGRERSR